MISLTASSSGSYSVNWKSQESHILDGLRSLVKQDGVILTDVTLACDGEHVKAHKLVLALCSSFFKDLFQKNRADKSNTIVILGNISARNLRYLLRFMYQGKVDVPKKHLDSFLEAGNMLKIQGLMGNIPEHVTEEINAALHKNDDCDYVPTSESNNSALMKKRRRRSMAKRIKRARMKEKNDSEEEIFDEESDYNEEVVVNDGNGDDVGQENIMKAMNIKKEPAAAYSAGTSSGVDEGAGFGTAEEIVPATFMDTMDETGSFSEGEQDQDPNNSTETKLLTKCKPKLKSPVWRFFIPSRSRTSAKCRLCKTILRTGGGCTTSLIRHLQGKHPGSLPEFQKASNRPEFSDEDNEGRH